MISVSEKHQQVKFVHVDYPDLSVAIIEGNTKILRLSSGILTTKYNLDEIKKDMVLYCMGPKITEMIMFAVDSVLRGERLTVKLFESLETEEELCEESLD